ELLGGTIGVSCDMCHPDASNTHPGTYPKYQVQLQRVALLRDMIDWCIENPVKGKTMDPNDERLRALEAYIIAQRKGVALDYGKHRTKQKCLNFCGKIILQKQWGGRPCPPLLPLLWLALMAGRDTRPTLTRICRPAISGAESTTRS